MLQLFEIVLSKVIVYYILAIWSMFIILGLGELLYDIPIRGNIIGLVFSLSVYVLDKFLQQPGHKTFL